MKVVTAVYEVLTRNIFCFGFLCFSYRTLQWSNCFQTWTNKI